MAISVEKDWLARAKSGDEQLNERTREDPTLAYCVATASRVAYEAGMIYQAAGNRSAAINNYVEAYRVGQFITRLYDQDPNSDFLASWLSQD